MSHCKTAVVTGAAGGIGSAVALSLAKSDFERIVLVYHNKMPDIRKLSETGKKIELFQGDLSASDTVKQLMATLPRLDLLVHCAGVSHYGLACDTSDADYRKVMGLDLDSAFYLAREANSLLLKSHGSVIFISSVWGVCGASCESVYSAAKAGVIGFTKALAKELAPMGIRVNAIAPGVIDTPMMDCFSEQEKQEIVNEIPLGRMGTGEDIAKAVQFLADCTYITGQTLVIDGGYIS
ncbi:MAG: SDR family oxidoreductase [Clostridia bacterium]|nr:SDR family oxidoreductase [Clostridia bacterium]